MIVDTSALVAVLRGEDGWEAIRSALLAEPGFVPAPVITEFARVTAFKSNAPDPDADELLKILLVGGLRATDFTVVDGTVAAAANEAHGTGNGRGGPLNFGDLMVYAVHRRTRMPILCTGRDFARTDAILHPASRRD